MKKKYYSKEYFRERNSLQTYLARTIENYMRQDNLKKVLDVGTGTGHLVKFLNERGFDAHGCDSSQQAILIAQKINKKAKIKKASADKLPYKNSSFDLVSAISVIEHLTKRQSREFIKEAKRVLKPNGYIFLVTPNFATPIRIIQGNKWFGYNDPTHINFFTPMSLKHLLKSNGFYSFKFLFKTNYHVFFDWEFSTIYRKFPKFLKRIAIFLFFASPLTFIRNSFWILAKNSK